MASAYAQFGNNVTDYEKLIDQERSYVLKLLRTTTPDQIFNRNELQYTASVSIEELSEVSKKAQFLYASFHFINREEIDLSAEWTTYTINLIDRICICLRPITGRWIWAHSEFDEAKSRWDLQQQYKKTAVNLLKALAEGLEYLCPVFDNVDARTIVEAIATYLLPDDPWCTSESNRIAKVLIDLYCPVPFDPEESGARILAETLRPVFKSAKHRNVSAAGRLSTSREHELRISFDTDDESPWTAQRPEAASLLHFVLSSADATFMSNNWPLLVPSILAIMDDQDPVYKARGCSILYLLLTNANPQVILVTGIAGIFWDALMTCLTYLPLGSSNVTVTDAVKLLDISYTDLIILSSIRSQDTASKTVSKHLVTTADAREIRKRQAKYLGSIIMEGIYSGMSLCGAQVEVAELLMAKLGIIAKNMEITFVVYLQVSFVMVT
ncbi:hypothetical protein V1525DRAFT_349573 [Lipomyces kononenkoae]|uniref:Uncharacterized protein n=1 Tax=Lipomyces kononenkoae TaxID=34357 RepID=A0ACC3ST20_LIPKO